MRARSGRNGTWIALAIGLLAVGVGLGGCDLLWLVAPDAPTGVEATDGGHVDRIAVAWQSVPRATHYEIYRATSEDGEYTRVGESTGTTYSDTEITVNVVYWYRVKACNRAGCSTLSAADSGYAHGEGVPSVVTGVAATDGTFTDRVRVTWNAAPGATRYEVWREVTEGGPYSLRSTVTGTTYDDREAALGRRYWYRVRACNALGCSAPSVPDSGFIHATAPDPATGVSASDGAHANRVVVTWTAATGAATYEVHRATAEGGPYTRLANTATTSFSDTGVVVGTTYWYRVVACNAAGCSAPSVPDSGFAQAGGGGGGGGGGGAVPVPGQPGGVSATDGAHLDRVRITWIGVSGATNYQIHRSTDSVTFVQIGATTTATTYDDVFQAATGKPVQCTTYWYAVTACNASGCGPMSVADSGYSGAPVPLPPTTVNATDGLHVNTITVTWSAVTGATSYEVWASTSSMGPYSAVGQTTSTTLHHTGLSSGATWFYRVRASSVCGWSGLSVFDQGSTCSVPATPTGVGAAPGTAGRIRITWTVVSGLRYEIWRSDTAVGPYTRIAEFATSPYDDTVPAGQTRFYRLRACNACGCSGFSTEVGATAP